MKPLITLFILLTVLISNVTAQDEGFDARIIAGMSAAQIRGDEMAGFNKVGLESGINVSYAIRYNMDLGIDLLFSQRGSRSNNSDFGERRIFRMNYLSIPVAVTVKDWVYEQENGFSYYKVFAQAGVSYGRLLSKEVEGALVGVPLENLSDAFNENDISWLLGAGYQFNYRLGARIRYNRSITKLFSQADNPSVNYNDLIPYHLSLQLTFKI